MASSRDYLDFVMEQLSDVEGVSYRPMMGEYVIYIRGKVAGGIFDDCFLVKPVKAACDMMPDAERVIPYEGAHEMLQVADIDDRDFLMDLLESMYEDLPLPKNKKKRD